MYPSGLVLAHQIVDLKQRLIEHQRLLGRVRVLLLEGKAAKALEELRDVVVVYDEQGLVFGRLLDSMRRAYGIDEKETK